ncbi:MAG: hypothetical protein ACLFQA_10220 [Bacteroidales bacterium]
MAEKNKDKENEHLESGDNPEERKKSSKIIRENDNQPDDRDHPESGDDTAQRERSSPEK